MVIILDNGTTAMTGLQEHPGTGRTLDHQPTGKVVIEDLVRSLGISSVHVTDPTLESRGLPGVGGCEPGAVGTDGDRGPPQLPAGGRQNQGI